MAPHVNLWDIEICPGEITSGAASDDSMQQTMGSCVASVDYLCSEGRPYAKSSSDIKEV